MLFGTFLRFVPNNSQNRRFSDVFTQKIDVVRTTAFDAGLRGGETEVLYCGDGSDWAMLIAYFRKEMESAKGTPIYEHYANYARGYDVIVGYIANDRMYVAVTEKACKQIKILSEEELSHLELLALRDMSAKRRKAGVELAIERLKEKK